jgi:hypothetical protein
MLFHFGNNIGIIRPDPVYAQMPDMVPKGTFFSQFALKTNRIRRYWYRYSVGCNDINNLMFQTREKKQKIILIVIKNKK